MSGIRIVSKYPGVTGAIVDFDCFAGGAGHGKWLRHGRPSTLNSAALTAATPGSSPTPVEHLQQRQSLRRRVDALHRLPGDQEHVRHSEPGIHARQLDEGPHQQTAHEQDDQAERHLHDDERTHRPRTGGYTPALRLQGRHRLDAGRAQRRGEPEQRAAQHGEPADERDQAPVDV